MPIRRWPDSQSTDGVSFASDARYAQLALDLGDPADAVEPLTSYLEKFIAEMPLNRPLEARIPQASGELQPKSPTDPYRRRARGLGHALGKGPMSVRGRDLISSLFREQPRVWGVSLHWQLHERGPDAMETEAALIASGPLKTEGADGVSHVEHGVEVARWPLSLLLLETGGEKFWNHQKDQKKKRYRSTSRWLAGERRLRRREAFDLRVRAMLRRLRP